MKRKLTKTVDYQRTESGQKHARIGISPEISMREDIHNGYAYGARDFIFFCVFDKELNEYYSVTGHNGEAFDDGENIMESLNFNSTGGKGTQGSGCKVSMYGLNSRSVHCKVIFASKTKKDGEKAYVLKNVSKTNLEIEDVSEDIFSKLKIMLGDMYEDYNVFYLKKYNPSFISSNNGRGKRDGDILASVTNMHSLNSVINIKDINVKYLDYHLKSVQPIRKKHIIHRIENEDDYVSKSFVLETKSVSFEEKVLDETIVHNFDAVFKVEIMPNLKSSSDNHGVVLNNRFMPSYSPKICSTTFNKFNFYLYQDNKLEGDHALRTTKEPIMVSKHITRHLCLEMGIDFLTDKDVFYGEEILNQPGLKEKVKELFLNKTDISLENYTLTPKIRVKCLLKRINDFSESFGPVDNSFYLVDDSKARELIKSAAIKLGEDNSEKLIECRNYLKSFKKDSGNVDILPCYSGTVARTNAELEIRSTDMTYKIASSIDIKVPKTEGGKIGSLPYGMPVGIPVSIYDRSTGTYLTEKDVKFNNEGLTISKDPSNKNVYFLQTSGLFHYEENERVNHELEEHKLGAYNYFPHTSHNDLIIKGDYKKLNFSVSIPLKKDYSRKATGPKNKVDKARYDFYKDMSDTPQTIAFYKESTGALILNKANPYIKKLTMDKDATKHTSIWKRIYQQMRDISKNIYHNKNNFVDKYQMRGNPDLVDEMGGNKGVFLNSDLKMFLETSTEAQKLMSISVKREKEILQRADEISMAI